MSSVELYRLLLSRGASAHLSGGWLKSLWSIRLPLDFLRSQSLKCGCPLFTPLFTLLINSPTVQQPSESSISNRPPRPNRCTEEAPWLLTFRRSPRPTQIMPTSQPNYTPENDDRKKEK